MKNPIKKFYDFLTNKYKVFTYKIWDNKYEIVDIVLPKLIGIPAWFIISILFVIVYIPLWFINLFIPGDD
jgi:hypothetical protein